MCLVTEFLGFDPHVRLGLLDGFIVRLLLGAVEGLLARFLKGLVLGLRRGLLVRLVLRDLPRLPPRFRPGRTKTPP